VRLLLDTHVLLWWLADPSKLGGDARDAIRNPQNPVFFSAASIWEISIKSALGKLPSVDRAEFQQALQSDAMESLAITASHAWRTAQLPFHHHAPFDRILIAQALEESLTLVTCDDKMQQYDVPLLMA
jgi:PIN domain nuclease of toxin-antitoxin system